MLYQSLFAQRTLLLCMITTSVLADVGDTSAPQMVEWSTKTHGPDGPWYAVSVAIGNPSPQVVDLLPGGMWMSNVLASTVCPNSGSDVKDCDASNAGFYDANKSKTAVQISGTGHRENESFSGDPNTLSTLFGSGGWTFDTATIPMVNTLGGLQSYNLNIDNFDLYTITSGVETLPDGTTYPAQIGKLALGATGFNQSWAQNDGPRFNATLLPGAVLLHGNAPSNSFGMHVGSVAKGIPPSLHFGGFDQTRALAPVSAQPYEISHLPIDLLDIGIGVGEGSSPFNFTSQDGLLAKGNSSMGVATTVYIEAPLTWLYLPQSTCDAITQNLPVTFQSKYGLYFWDIDSPDYAKIISSPAFLSFTFRLSGSVSRNMTINVPFSLLNMTLSAPIINKPTPYLPLRPGLGPHGKYELGRAFLQAAFIGVNWQTAMGDGNGAWFLAQAPGPNTPSKSTPTTIKQSDTTIVGSSNVWKDTWKGSWTVINEAGDATSVGGSRPAPKATGTSSKKGSGGLSGGAIAGIAIGVIAVLAACLIGAWFLFKRRKSDGKPGEGEPLSPERIERYAQSQQGKPSEMEAKGPMLAMGGYNGTNPVYNDHAFGAAPTEMDARRPNGSPIEMSG